MKWSDDYNIGIPNIDQQHKKLADTIDTLEDSLTTKFINRQMANTLKFLVDYTLHHFAEEEEVMESIEYPELEAHKVMHLNLVKDIKKILLKLKQKEQINANDLIDFLNSWLKDHILEQDLKIGKHIQVSQIPEAPPKKEIPKSITQELINKLKALKTSYEKKLITDEAFSNKKSYLISDFIELQFIETKDALNDNFKFLDQLLELELIHDSNHTIFQKQLANKIDLKSILTSLGTESEKQELLDSLSEKALITPEKHRIFKEQLIQPAS